MRPCSSPLLLNPNEISLSNLISRPANRRARRSSHNPSIHAPEEPPRALSPPNNPRSTEQSPRVPDLHISRRAPGLQQSLDDIQRRRRRSGEPPSEPTRRAVRERVVGQFAAPLHDLRQRLVGRELQRREGHRHRERRRVGDVEGAQAFLAHHRARAVGEGPVG